MSRAQVHVAVVCAIGLISLSKIIYNHVSTTPAHRVVSSTEQIPRSLSPELETAMLPPNEANPSYWWILVTYIVYTSIFFAALTSLYLIVSPSAYKSVKTHTKNLLQVCRHVLFRWWSSSNSNRKRKQPDPSMVRIKHGRFRPDPDKPGSLLSKLLHPFSKDFIFTVIDMMLLVYFVRCGQYLIALLFLVILALNAWRASSNYLKNLFRIISEFDIVLFHTTFQLLPLSFSIAFYATDNRYIDLAFAFIFCSFIFTLYNESEKLSRDSDNNTKMLKIMCLCVILDYIHVITLILCRLYLTNAFYFYKFMLIEAFCLVLYWCIVYSEGFVYRGPAYYVRNLRLKDMWNFFWFTMFLHVGIPIFMECCSASWIIFIYERFLSKLRANHSKRFAETLRDELVQWLEADKEDVLVKICCVNHIKLAHHVGQPQKHALVKEQHLVAYLDENVQCHQSYYRNVEWNKVVYQQDEDVLDKLKKMVVDFYSPNNRLWNELQRAMNDYRQQRHFRNFHKLLTAVGGCLLIAYLAFYAVLKLFHIFVLPMYTLWVMDDVMNIYQACFIAMYFGLEAVILYKLYELLNYEKIMWYALPNLQNLNLTETDIQTFKQYYEYIKVGRFEMEHSLAQIFGLDVAKLVMLYVPDFIALYKAKQS